MEQEEEKSWKTWEAWEAPQVEDTGQAGEFTIGAVSGLAFFGGFDGETDNGL